MEFYTSKIFLSLQISFADILFRLDFSQILQYLQDKTIILSNMENQFLQQGQSSSSTWCLKELLETLSKEKVSRKSFSDKTARDVNKLRSFFQKMPTNL